MRIRVSLAKYEKGGKPFVQKMGNGEASRKPYRTILNPSFRDGRKYSDVLRGRKLRASTADRDANTIPFLFTINVDENDDMGKDLKHAYHINPSSQFLPQKLFYSLHVWMMLILNCGMMVYCGKCLMMLGYGLKAKHIMTG